MVLMFMQKYRKIMHAETMTATNAADPQSSGDQFTTLVLLPQTDGLTALGSTSAAG